MLKRLFWVLLLAIYAVNFAGLVNEAVVNGLGSLLNYRVWDFITLRLLIISIFAPLMEESVKFAAFRALYRRFEDPRLEGLGIAVLFGIMERILQGGISLLYLIKSAVVSAPHAIFFVPVAVWGPQWRAFLVAVLTHAAWNWMARAPWPWEAVGLPIVLGVLAWPWIRDERCLRFLRFPR